MEDHIDQFLEHIRNERNLSKHTVRGYATDLKQFFTFLDKKGQGNLSPDKISHHIVRNYLAELNREKYSKTSIARKLAALRSLYKFLIRNGFVESNPVKAVRTPRLPQKLPHFLDPGEVEKLLTAPQGDSLLALRDRAILETLYSTGVRVSELVGINIADLDLDECMVIVRGKGRKERVALLGRHAVSAIKTYLRVRSSHPKKERFDKKALFLNKLGTRLSDRSVRREIDKYLVQTGLSIKTSPHTLRHSFATHMLNAGANLRDVQELLGHKSLAATQIYTHLTTNRLKEIYESSHPRS